MTDANFGNLQCEKLTCKTLVAQTGAGGGGGGGATTLTGDVTGSGTGSFTTTYSNVVPVNKGGTGATTHTADRLLAGNVTDPIISTGLRLTNALGTDTLFFSNPTVFTSNNTTLSVQHGVRFEGGNFTIEGNTFRNFLGPPANQTYGGDVTLSALNETISFATNTFLRIGAANMPCSVQTITVPTSGGWQGLAYLVNATGLVIPCVDTGNINAAFDLTPNSVTVLLYHAAAGKWYHLKSA